MFDLNDEKLTSTKRENAWDRTFSDEGGPDKQPQRHEMDSEENCSLHGKLISMYQRELDRQSDNRIQQAIDEDFYDSIQWTEEDAAALRARGQAPIAYNVIAQSVNWIIGTEKRGRTDWRILPRGKEDSKAAERKTQLMKYLSDVNRSPFHRSRAFEDAAKVGIGWLETGAQEDDDGELIYDRYESWRNIVWDSASTEMDLSDCRYVFRSKWVDVDVACALFPDRADVIKRSASDGYGGGYDSHGDEVMDQAEDARELEGSERQTGTYRRDRVRLIEAWFRKPEKVKRIVDGPWRGDMYDESHPARDEIEQAEHAGKQVTADRLMFRMHCAIMVTDGLLYCAPSPYRHNQFPFTPIWGYRRGRDGMPYGVIRPLRDIQDSINKRASKALYILSSNKVIMDEGAVDDIEQFRQEVARPDAVIEKKAGKQIQLNVDRQLAESHINLMGRDIAMIQQVGGVTDEQMGRTTNATSGRAIEARQMQGSMTTAKLFDNLRFAVQCQGEKMLSLEEQFYTEEKRFRITNTRGAPEYVAINDSEENDITRSKADFVVGEGDWRASIREAAAEQLLEMMTRMPPQVAMVMLDLVVDSMDLPNREELVTRIRQINGQRDPDAEEPTPEELAMMEQQAQQAQLQQAMIEAELRKKMADAGWSEARAQRELSRISEDMAKAANTNVNTQQQAILAAQLALMNAPAMPAADRILRESGFISRTEQEHMAQQQAMMEQQAAEEQAMMEQQAMEQQAVAEQGGIVPDGAEPQQPI